MLYAGWFHCLSRVSFVVAEEQREHSMCISATWQVLRVPPKADTGTATTMIAESILKPAQVILVSAWAETAPY